MNGYTILRVELEDGSESAYAEYSSFSIADENDKYRIHVSGYSGTASLFCFHVHVFIIESFRRSFAFGNRRTVNIRLLRKIDVTNIYVKERETKIVHLKTQPSKGLTS